MHGSLDFCFYEALANISESVSDITNTLLNKLNDYNGFIYEYTTDVLLTLKWDCKMLETRCYGSS